jgi:FAD dependent oxidoreductase
MTLSRPKHVAVLGAGIMGSSIALLLARRGAHVTLYDAAPMPFARTSRWNEGKIHLGFLYSADPSKTTVHRLLPGGLGFRTITEELIGCSIQDAITPANDIYLVHRDSVVDPGTIRRHFHDVTELVRGHPAACEYLVDVSGAEVRPLSRHEIQELADPDRVIAGYQVPERSVRTTWIADRFLDALRAERGIDFAMNTRISAVRPAGTDIDGRWILQSEPRVGATFDVVVNALWESGIAIDSTVGLRPEANWSHRFRLSLFARTDRPVNLPSAVIATGPFGDIKNYTNQDFYLSWYYVGLLAEGADIAPPPIPALTVSDRQRIIHSIVENLSDLIPRVREIAENSVEMVLEGGWVFAIGEGSLADLRSTLHRRHRFGLRRAGSYVSINTGKYSIAPWLAREAADRIMGCY